MTFAMFGILALLTLVVTFGFGFILNMFAKRWWLSLIVFFALVVYILYRTEFGLKILDWVLIAVGSIGVGAAGWGFRRLQKQGYRMFQ
jgi:hypothetical protein